VRRALRAEARDAGVAWLELEASEDAKQQVERVLALGENVK
jgi:bifunctional enzyme CysN/CysC/sulfate adenylyltransferase subunit 1